MLKRSIKLGTVAQNVIIGSVTGIMVGYNLRIIFMRLGGVDLVWMAFFVLGPALGYFSGRERQRIERLRNEKKALESNLDEIQHALRQSAKKYKLLVEQANDAIFLTTIDGRFLIFNEATCLLSGYHRNDLKKITLDDLKTESKLPPKETEAWLDNGVYRYEEIWTKKSGQTVTLEINARWIQFSDHRLILHVGRDIQRRKEVGKDERIRLYQEAQEYHVRQSGFFHDHLFQQILDPMYETIKTLKHIQTKYPQTEGVTADLLKMWDAVQKNLMELSLKNDRDLSPTPAQWAINDILHQELVYLDIQGDMRNFRVKTSLTQDLPQVFGHGWDYSVAFGAVFKALKETLAGKPQQGLWVSTRLMDDAVAVEALAPGEDNFKDKLHEVLNPFHSGGEALSVGPGAFAMAVLQSMFKAFDAQIDVGYQAGKGTMVRIRVPAVPSQDSRRADVRAVDSENSIVI